MRYEHLNQSPLNQNSTFVNQPLFPNIKIALTDPMESKSIPIGSAAIQSENRRRDLIVAEEERLVATSSPDASQSYLKHDHGRKTGVDKWRGFGVPSEVSRIANY
ncbi:hypothetical protein PAAG_11200 [Paracoccidioides lutzii Pb01]|uniref:Uncharacterized protein n=1 Tax=Paracoccidioides lutzii (strain ATCC MYA-826 / Pb01) TaxID=502779 RepID=A0A0A2VME7_PARBA|nr:hypothetical protein PAAG_11200 [Paracoccidioides lutzii Pb01]KGQ02024.1 hypothetical protein PAAG_11200 [Paracoccidioides lutzii Pb01]